MPNDFYNLRQRIRGKYARIGDFAKALRITKGTLSLKLMGKSEWKRAEIARAAELLDLTPEEILYYFFQFKMCKIAQNGERGHGAHTVKFKKKIFFTLLCARLHREKEQR